MTKFKLKGIAKTTAIFSFFAAAYNLSDYQNGSANSPDDAKQRPKISSEHITAPGQSAITEKTACTGMICSGLLSRMGSSAVLTVATILLILILPQRPGLHLAVRRAS